MFGYVIPNQKELKVRELEEYRGWYCGLCHRLQKGYGLRGRLALNYEMAFLGLLLSSLYDPGKIRREGTCMAHPLKKQISYDTSCVGYAADMDILLTYYKCMDDWKDDHDIFCAGYGSSLRRSAGKVAGRYPGQACQVRRCLQDLDRAERRRISDLDKVSGIFGRLCGSIFAWRDDIWRQDLWQMGFYLGKFIYLLDAWDDLEKDYRTGCYNPLLFFVPDIRDGTGIRKPELESRVADILTRMIAESCRYFERLPVVEHAGILRNILYSGVWTKFYQVRKAPAKGNDREGSHKRSERLK